MPTCPSGHESSTADYCDTCGAPMSAAPDGTSAGPTPDAAPVAGVNPPTPPPPMSAPPMSAPPTSAPPTPATAPGPSAAGPAAAPDGGDPDELTCPACGAVRTGRFCEVCGQDAAMPVSAGPPGAASEPSGHREPEPGSWTALVRADRAWFDQVQAKEGPDAASVGFPPYCPDRLFALSGRQLSVGRGSRSRGIAPEIDLSGPPLDPGVSALHAMFVPHGEGWAVVDLDSTNGTTVNGSAETIPPNTPVPVADGDRIHLGAWTTITVARTPQG